MIRIVLPFHLRNLAQIDGEVTIDVNASNGSDPSIADALDALEAKYPMLSGAIRDHLTKQRRPFLRYFACEQDLSHEPPDTPLPEPVIRGEQPLLIVGAIAGG